MKPDRGAMWRRLGPPTDQEGSAIEPRTHVDRGLVWNEKWVYVDPKSGDTERVVLWHRYELQGVFTVMPDGSWVAEPIGTA